MMMILNLIKIINPNLNLKPKPKPNPNHNSKLKAIPNLNRTILLMITNNLAISLITNYSNNSRKFNKIKIDIS